MVRLCDGNAQERRYPFNAVKMGGPMSIIICDSSADHAYAVADACFSLTDSLIAILSDYEDSSELNRLCARAGRNSDPFLCSPVLFDILEQSRRAWVISRGSFDISLGPVTRLWRSARKTKVFPTPAAIREKLRLTGMHNLVLDTQQHTARLLRPGMRLDLGGIGQGYMATKIAAYLQSRQINHALINISGDIVCLGHPPGATDWTVAINYPESRTAVLPRKMALHDMAVTTSGDVYQYLFHQGRKYSHLVDPLTGYGLTTQKNVTVVAASGTMADWLTKACSVLPVKMAIELAASLHASVLITELKNGQLRRFSTPGFDRLWQGAGTIKKGL